MQKAKLLGLTWDIFRCHLLKILNSIYVVKSKQNLYEHEHCSTCKIYIFVYKMRSGINGIIMPMRQLSIKDEMIMNDVVAPSTMRHFLQDHTHQSKNS